MAETGRAWWSPIWQHLLYGPKIFYYRVFKLVGKKNHKYHRENILELTVSYIYVNLHFLIYIVMYSFMYIQAINILLSQFMFLYLILVF
ncbi:hypothetical protein ACRRTK_011252 [Alexandromys fortis]